MDRPKIMIVGTFHMAGHSDLRGIDVGDVLTDEKQKEIGDVVHKLKAYRATKIALETAKKDGDNLNKDYHCFLDGKFTLTSNEKHQIAFRLAKEMNHPKIYAADWRETGVLTREIGEVIEYAKQNQPDLYDYFLSCQAAAIEAEKEKGIVEIYKTLNSQSYIRIATELYLNIARVGMDEDYIGMGWLLWWYQRNMIIFANLAELATNPSERILLLIGASHTGILNGFLSDSGLFDVVSAADYL